MKRNNTDPKNLSGLGAALVWCLSLVLTLAVLHLLGRGPLGGPPAGVGWSDWLARTEPLVAAFAVVRLGCLAVAWYLVGVTVIGALGRLLALPRLVRFAGLLVLPGTRRLLQTAFGLGLAAAAVAGPGRVGADVPPSDVAAVAVLREVTDAGTETLRSLDGLPPALADAPAEPAPPGAEPPPPAAPATWEVVAGDHFWNIAERVLTRAWGRAPGEKEIARYWQTLISANTDRLRDPGNPDLLYPGQVLEVPEPGQRDAY